MIVLFTDTDTDITKEKAKELGYELIYMPYSINDKDITPYQDKYDSKEYYDLLRSGIIPKTSAISPGDYINYFEPHFKDGNDILYVHFSKAMSGTFNSMNIALEELYSRYPERRLYTIDTMGITILSYNICLMVSKLFKEGKSIDEILSWAKDEVLNYSCFFYANDLKFFKRSGRISNFSAIMGTIIGLHPIIHIDDKGIMKSIAKARGRKNALKRLLDYVVETENNIKDHKVVIGHSDAYKLACEFKQMLIDKFGDELDIDIVVVNPTAGAHCGPDNIGVSFHSKGR